MDKDMKDMIPIKPIHRTSVSIVHRRVVMEMIQMIQVLWQAIKIKINLLCHKVGNFILPTEELSRLSTTTILINRTLMV